MRVLKTLIASTAISMALAAALHAEEMARITVTGEGHVDATPDMATISLGVTTQGDSAAAALAANSAELTRVLENLRAAGIEARDVQTSGLSLNPTWAYDSNGNNPKITSYGASNQLNVRVRALDNLGGILDAAVRDGANTLNGLTFGVSQQDSMMDTARKLAVADAMRRAHLLTDAAGVGLGSLISITEDGGYNAPAPMFRMQAEAVGSAPVPVAGGEVSVAANVTMVFALAP